MKHFLNITIIMFIAIPAYSGSGTNGGHSLGARAVTTMRNFVTQINHIGVSKLTDKQQKALRIVSDFIDEPHKVTVNLAVESLPNRPLRGPRTFPVKK